MGKFDVAYATLSDVLEEIRNDGIQQTDNRFIMRALYTVSRRIDSTLGFKKRPVFAPVAEARPVHITPHTVNSHAGTLELNNPLLALTSLSVNGTALTTAQANVYPSGAYPPYTYLGLVDCYYGYSWYNIACSTCHTLTATVTGVWGIHRDYANAWVAVDALAANITDSATTLTVANADGNDPLGLTPRLSAGSIIRIDSEVMTVLAVDVNNNIVTVARAMLGTTAAAHTATTAVYAWQVEDDIRRVTARQVGMMNSRRGAYNRTVTDMAGATVTYPTDLLPDLTAVLDDYQYIGAV